MIYEAIRKHLGVTFHELAKRKGVIIEEGHLMKDHVHICLSIPPKFAVSNVVGYLKGKSAITIPKLLEDADARSDARSRRSMQRMVIPFLSAVTRSWLLSEPPVGQDERQPSSSL